MGFDQSKSVMTVGNQGGSFDVAFSWLVKLFALATVLVLVWMSWVIAEKASPAMQSFGLGFVWRLAWDVGANDFGAKTYIYGTLITSIISLMLAVPVGVSVAVVTSENFLPLQVRSTIAFIVELLAAIPSVIVGLWGIFVLIPVLNPFQVFLHETFPKFLLFNTPPFGPSILIASVILAIMILPTIAAISREALQAIPKDFRSASMALGATRWESIFGVILPAAFPGILGGVTLALGRALGETMAVTMVIGNSDEILSSLLAPGNTIPAILANQFPEATEGLHLGALMYLGLILFVLTLIVNIAAELMVWFFAPKQK